MAALVSAFLLHDIPITHDVVGQFWIAAKMDKGAITLSRHLGNHPPLWFWSAIPVHQVATWLPCPRSGCWCLILSAWELCRRCWLVIVGCFTSSIARFAIMLLAFG